VQKKGTIAVADRTEKQQNFTLKRSKEARQLRLIYI